MSVYLVRVTLDAEVRARRERQHEVPGVSMVGGTHFLDGVAYLPAGATLVRNLSSGEWRGATIEPAASTEEAEQHADRVRSALRPEARPVTECHPGQCAYGGPGLHGCRTVYPQNFPPPSATVPGTAL